MRHAWTHHPPARSPPPLRSLVLAVLVVVAASGSAHAVGRACGPFVVGRANSTAYPHFRLPARGHATLVPCATLERIARRLNDGTYAIPNGASAAAPHWGPPFAVRDAGRSWSCRLQRRGASGPTYAVRCASGRARLSWNTG